MKSAHIQSEIDVLETYSKQGQSYTNSEGRYGWRNPIRKDTGKILTALVLAHAPNRVLEIGSGHGLSTLYMVAGLKPEATMESIEFDAEVAKTTQERMNKCKAPVTIHQGDAMQVIETLEGKYDLVFFDAQKSHYHQQLLQLIERDLIGSGALLLADNVLDRKSECQSFLDWFEQNGVNHEILETECGLLVARL